MQCNGMQCSGWCAGFTEQVAEGMDTCYERSKKETGSSTSYPPYLVDTRTNLSPVQSENPLMYNWNAVYVPYCDGGSQSGDRGVCVCVCACMYVYVMRVCRLFMNEYKRTLCGFRTAICTFVASVTFAQYLTSCLRVTA